MFLPSSQFVFFSLLLLTVTSLPCERSFPRLAAFCLLTLPSLPGSLDERSLCTASICLAICLLLPQHRAPWARSCLYHSRLTENCSGCSSAVASQAFRAAEGLVVTPSKTLFLQWRKLWPRERSDLSDQGNPARAEVRTQVSRPLVQCSFSLTDIINQLPLNAFFPVFFLRVLLCSLLYSPAQCLAHSRCFIH